MAAVIRSKLSAILPLIKTQLMATTSFPTERVLISMRDVHPNVMQADQYIVIRPRGSVTDEPIEIGAGRVDTRLSRRVAIILRTRLEIDQDHVDVEWLTNATYGHLDVEHQIINSLQDFQVIDGSANWLVVKPLKLGPVSDPNPVQEFTGWGQSVQEYEVKYEADLTQTYQ